jgi:hypothetical protein
MPFSSVHKRIATIAGIFVLFLWLNNLQISAAAQALTTTPAATAELAKLAQQALTTQLGLSPKTDVMVGDIHIDQGFAYGIMAIPGNLSNIQFTPRVYWFVAKQVNSAWNIAIEYTLAFYSMMQALPSTTTIANIRDNVFASNNPNFDLVSAAQQGITTQLGLNSATNVLINNVKIDGAFMIGNFTIPSTESELGSEGGTPSLLFDAEYTGQGWQVGILTDGGAFFAEMAPKFFSTIRVPDTTDYVPPGVPAELISAAKQSLIAYLGHVPSTGIWVGDINVFQGNAVGTLLVPLAVGTKENAQPYSFFARVVNRTWQVAFLFTPEFNAMLVDGSIPVQLLPPDQQQYLMPVDDSGDVIRLAEHALILRIGYIPTQGIVATHVTIEKGFIYGGVGIPFPDGVTTPAGAAFIARQIGQTWQVALKGTPEFDTLLQGVTLNPPGATRSGHLSDRCSQQVNII